MRESTSSDGQGAYENQGQERSLLLVRVCVPRVGMRVKGRGTWEGGLVWEISIFLKTTILIHH